MTESTNAASSSPTGEGPASAEGAPQPARVIGPWGAFSIVAGSMIGVGIFIFLDEIARGVGTVPLFFAMLVVGGLFALCGAVACGELGAMMPNAGGDYVFQRAAYGKSVAFASGWVLFAAIFAGSIATLAIPLFKFDIGPLLGIDMSTPIAGHLTCAHFSAIGLILLLTALNDFGTSVSAKVQAVLAMLPIALMLIFSVIILVARPTVVMPPSVVGETSSLPSALTLAGLATAFLNVNFIF